MKFNKNEEIKTANIDLYDLMSEQFDKVLKIYATSGLIYRAINELKKELSSKKDKYWPAIVKSMGFENTMTLQYKHINVLRVEAYNAAKYAFDGINTNKKTNHKHRKWRADDERKAGTR